MSISDEYLPRNKHDFERVNQFKKLNRKELLPLLPGLLEWISGHELADSRGSGRTTTYVSE
jgi:hypothetical protein